MPAAAQFLLAGRSLIDEVLDECEPEVSRPGVGEGTVATDF
jgi:hypothetical protein